MLEPYCDLTMVQPAIFCNCIVIFGVCNFYFEIFAWFFGVSSSFNVYFAEISSFDNSGASISTALMMYLEVSSDNDGKTSVWHVLMRFHLNFDGFECFNDEFSRILSTLVMESRFWSCWLLILIKIWSLWFCLWSQFNAFLLWTIKIWWEPLHLRKLWTRCNHFEMCFHRATYRKWANHSNELD